MNDNRVRPALLKIAAKGRWSPITEGVVAGPAGRYVGPVVHMDGTLVQRVAAKRAVLHDLDGMDFSSSDALLHLAATGALDDRVLAIYYINGAKMAYLRETVRSPWQEAEKPAIRETTAPQTGKPNRRSHSMGRFTGTVATAVATTLALAACASKNRLVTPDGSERVAINTPESLSRYQDLVARQDAIGLEKSELQRKYEALTQQVEKLKTFVLEQQRKEQQGGTPVSPAPKGTPTVPGAAPRPPASGKSGAVVVGSNSVVFRVNHDVGQTAFTPTAKLADEIVKAAKAAKVIVIRGRTDSAIVDDVEARIALGRAVRARQFLLSNGVDSRKMHVWYRAAGGFIAENSTPQGRAENRRVEIEARGLDTSALVSATADTRVGRNE